MKASYKIAIFAVLAVAGLAAVAQNVTGRVTCGGAGVAGVPVSDGYVVVTTDQDGRYAFQSEKRNGYVFITTPRGYEPELKNGFNPQFWQPFLNRDLATVEMHDFALKQVNNDKYTLILGADTHIAKRLRDRRTYKNGYIQVLKREKAQADAEGHPIYSMILGDLTWDAFWYQNDYRLNNFMDDQAAFGYPMALWPVIGNHDNDPSVPCTDSTDFLSSKPWREIVSPNYYSFNLGKVHYVVLDNIHYTNNPVSDGKKLKKNVWGSRDYSCRVEDYEIAWLKQDLAMVDKNTPIMVCFHIPSYRLNNDFETFGAMQNYKELSECFAGYTKVHYLSGHTHYNYCAHSPEFPNIMEHNIAAVCASWWRTGFLTGVEMCTDGSPAGFSRWHVDGDSLNWKYASVQDAADPQFRVTDMNSVRNFMENSDAAQDITNQYEFAPTWSKWGKNSILINVFAWDDDWKIEVTEDGTPLETKRVQDIDPAYYLAYCLPQHRSNDELSKAWLTGTRHIFKAVAKNADTPVTVTVTDSFGHVYTKTITRPAPFELHADNLGYQK